MPTKTKYRGLFSAIKGSTGESDVVWIFQKRVWEIQDVSTVPKMEDYPDGDFPTLIKVANLAPCKSAKEMLDKIDIVMNCPF